MGSDAMTWSPRASREKQSSSHHDSKLCHTSYTMPPKGSRKRAHSPISLGQRRRVECRGTLTTSHVARSASGIEADLAANPLCGVTSRRSDHGLELYRDRSSNWGTIYNHISDAGDRTVL